MVIVDDLESAIDELETNSKELFAAINHFINEGCYFKPMESFK